MDKTIAVCPGSFDPVTCGHIDIIKRAAKMFGQVIVVVMTNTAKRPLFSGEKRADMLRRSLCDLPNVQVDCYDGLLADYMRKVQGTAIVKGLRAVSDFEYEFQMALTNKKLCPEAETVFLTADAQNMYLSSSIVKSVGSMGGDIRDFVPPPVYEEIQERLVNSRKEDIL
ncbi:MAG: pantetheine-phosphate adenylyltransferase [Clostridia bacterium]|nr:pantetheine-phosphate adenylyltransferase [Clostridia bacterium]